MTNEKTAVVDPHSPRIERISSRKSFKDRVGFVFLGFGGPFGIDNHLCLNPNVDRQRRSLNRFELPVPLQDLHPRPSQRAHLMEWRYRLSEGVSCFNPKNQARLSKSKRPRYGVQ